MAGFEVTFNGRFCLTAEAQGAGEKLELNRPKLQALEPVFRRRK